MMYEFAKKHSITGFEAAGIMFAIATEIMASALVREGLLQGGPQFADEDEADEDKFVLDEAPEEQEN